MEDKFLQIEKYISGELQGRELSDFEEKLKTDTNFAEELAIYKDLESSMCLEAQKRQKQKDVEATFSDLGSLYFEEEKTKSIVPTNNQSVPKQGGQIRKTILGITSIAAVLFFVFLLRGFLQTPSTPQDLYSDYAIHNPIEITQMGDANNKILIEAAQTFNQKKYAESLPKFNTYLAKESDDSEIILYRGIAYLETDNLTKAIDDFRLISEGNSVYTNDALWYWGLTCLKQGKTRKALYLFSQIPQNNQRYQDVQDILRKLK